MGENVVNPELNNEIEESSENVLRPQTLNEYIGQTGVKEKMQVYICILMMRVLKILNLEVIWIY